MYIGKQGDGQSPDDGIYVLAKEVIDNSIDEHMQGAGKKIIIDIEDHSCRVRDFGRGIPLGKVIDCVSKMNTGGKYDSEAFQKSVGMNGVGTKAVNALSSLFVVKSSPFFSSNIQVGSNTEAGNGFPVFDYFQDTVRVCFFVFLVNIR